MYWQEYLNYIQEYLNYIQEMRDVSGKRVPSPSAVLKAYEDRVIKRNKKLFRKCKGRMQLTKKQTKNYELCKARVIASMDITPPKCPNYQNRKDTEKCNGWIRAQYASFKYDLTQARKKLMCEELKNQRAEVLNNSSLFRTMERRCREQFREKSPALKNCLQKAHEKWAENNKKLDQLDKKIDSLKCKYR
jgi:septin family protein